jgi:hypothetical protein
MKSVALVVAASFAAAAAFALTLSAVRAEDAPASEKPTYVGSDACKKCHFKEYTAWKKGAMAKAMNTLKPTTEADNKDLFKKKTDAKLDPAKDYTTDAKCLKCHTTGYGEPGGYPADASKDEKAAAAMGNVSCESCHGPGSNYVKYKEPIVQKDAEEKKETKFKWEDLAKYGLTKPDETVCAKCHNKDAPTQPAEPFKFDDAKAKVHPVKK